MTNEEILDLIQKAGILTSTGGQLSAEELDKFIEDAIDASDFLQDIRVEQGIATSRNLDIIGVASRLMLKATEATDPGTTNAVSLPRRTLTPVEAMLPYDISMRFLRKNIERAGAEQSINRAFAKQFSADTVDLAWNGDSTSLDTFIKITDGFLVQAAADGTVHTDNYGANDKLVDVFDAMMAELPSKYVADKAALRFYVSFATEQAYRKELAGRNTGMGDLLLVKGGEVMYNGILVKPVFAVPNTKIMLTKNDNLAVGFGEVMSVGKDVVYRSQNIKYTIIGEVSANHVIGDAMVLYTKV